MEKVAADDTIPANNIRVHFDVESDMKSTKYNPPFQSVTIRPVSILSPYCFQVSRTYSQRKWIKRRKLKNNNSTGNAELKYATNIVLSIAFWSTIRRWDKLCLWDQCWWGRFRSIVKSSLSSLKVQVRRLSPGPRFRKTISQLALFLCNRVCVATYDVELLHSSNWNLTCHVNLD